jgi:outer membrane PBP1 activator LpoA protein
VPGLLAEVAMIVYPLAFFNGVLIVSYLNKIVLTLVVLLLSQCTKVTKDSQLQVSQQLASPYTMSAPAYLALANNQEGTEKQSLLLMAAGRLIYDGQWQQGLEILSQAGPLTETLKQQKTLLLAKIDLIRERPQAAISKLATMGNVSHLSIYYQVQYHEMLASAYQSTGQALESVSERSKLENLLPDETSRGNNRRALWLSLTTLPKAELETLAAEASESSVLNGWVRLALIARGTYSHPDVELQKIAQWQAQFSQHPANRLLPTPLDTVRPRLFNSPKHIALLLPLTGPLAGPGHAIEDGFMAAYEASGRAGSVNIKSYDTNESNVIQLYQQAYAQGADYIVGPLTKTDVARVAREEHPVPTLLLNDLDASTRGQAYQFGLSPTHEARQVAMRARKNGHGRALIIAPAGTWGDEIVNAFTHQWQSANGRVVDTFRYAPETNLNTSIRTLLHVSDEELKRKKREHSEAKIETSSLRRADFDMVFLVAYPSQARQIMPLLKYYYIGKIPVYATSSVYAGNINTIRDRDLNGIIFCDMPWIFDHQIANRNWPEQLNSYNRLYALGLDAYVLSTQLNQLILFPALGMREQSGVLYLNPSHQIARILSFGQFRQGLAERL